MKSKSVFLHLLSLFSSCLLLMLTMVGNITYDNTAYAVSTEEYIFNFFTQRLGYNSAVACGFLANIYRESTFNPEADNGYAYGLIQWEGGRRQQLNAFCNDNGYNISSIDAQLLFIQFELENDERGCASKILNHNEDAQGAYDAAYNICYYYERPANKAWKSNDRGEIARDTYWPQYGGGGHDCHDYELDIPYCRPSGSPLIQKGSKGHYVGWVQIALEKLGYDVGGVDCDFGGNTDSAVRAFQSDHGLEVDGQVGPATIAKIVELLKKPDDTEAPVISNAQVFDIDATGYSIKCTVTDNVGVTKVQFPTWTENNGQDDLIWHDASVSGNTYSYRISVSDHNNEYGRYVTHIYAWDAAGNSTSAGGADFELKVGSKMDKGAGQTIPDGDYYIFSGLMDNYYLDIDGSEVPAESKTSVHMWTSSSDKLPPECDAWTVKHEGNGFYTISQKGTPICLDLYGANPTRGASICVHTANGSDAQLWSISSTGKGYSIQAKCSGYCLDVYGSEKNNGTAVLVWEATNNPNQEWMFVPLLEAPQTSIIKADKKSVLVGESITFSAESDTASDYTIIVKSGADEVLQQKMVNGKASLSFTDAADYTAYVTAYNEKGSIDSGTIKFNVTSNIIIQEGDSFPIPITDEKLTYKSHNTNVATVSKDGLITGKQKGTTVVSVVTKDNDVIQYTVNVVETFIEGDCNSDGNFDIADVILLQKWLLTEVKTLDNWKVADFCQDNRLDVFDLCLMKRKLING